MPAIEDHSYWYAIRPVSTVVELLKLTERVKGYLKRGIRVPDGIDAQRLSSILRTKHHVVVAGGLLQLQGKILRIGHMGIVKETEVEELLAALRSGLSEVGYTVPS